MPLCTALHPLLVSPRTRPSISDSAASATEEGHSAAAIAASGEVGPCQSAQLSALAHNVLPSLDTFGRGTQRTRKAFYFPFSLAIVQTNLPAKCGILSSFDTLCLRRRKCSAGRREGEGRGTRTEEETKGRRIVRGALASLSLSLSLSPSLPLPSAFKGSLVCTNEERVPTHSVFGLASWL